MIQYDDIRVKLNNRRPELADLKDALQLDRAEKEIQELEHKAAEPGFWDNMEKSQEILRRTTQLRSKVENYHKLESLADDIETMIQLAEEEEDPSMADEVKEMYETFEHDLEEQTLSALLIGEYDDHNAILTFHAGAGGTEAQDWVEMLYRMYTHWAEKHGFTYQILDYQPGDDAGIKSASIQINGQNAYGYLRSENGVHRLVRVSPFDASGRRHTSFASLEVMPEIDDTIQVDIREEDIKMDVFRSSGAGGQHINKTSSAVRLTHIPTGIVVSCQTERSQFQNRDTAMKMLKSKLFEIKQREHLDKIEDIKGEHKEIAWGSQIRSYVFMPYTLVKDTRTGYETSNVGAVMDGDLDGFIYAYLKQQEEQK